MLQRKNFSDNWINIYDKRHSFVFSRFKENPKEKLEADTFNSKMTTFFGEKCFERLI